MAKYAALVTRAAGERRWHATEPDIAGIEDAQDLADLMRENDPDVALLFFEQDDEWLTIVRLDADGVLRTFPEVGEYNQTI